MSKVDVDVDVDVDVINIIVTITTTPPATAFFAVKFVVTVIFAVAIVICVTNIYLRKTFAVLHKYK